MIGLTFLTLISSLSQSRPNACQPLAPGLLEHIRRTLPGYEVAPTTDFEKSWLTNRASTEQTDGTPWCISGDFDGNGQTDVVLFLKHKGTITVMGFRAVADSYVHALAFSRTNIPYRPPLHLALFRSPPGRIQGGGVGDEPSIDVKNKNPGISLEFFESSSVYLYWAKGRWHEVWTSD